MPSSGRSTVSVRIATSSEREADDCFAGIALSIALAGARGDHVQVLLLYSITPKVAGPRAFACTRPQRRCTAVPSQDFGGDVVRDVQLREPSEKVVRESIDLHQAVVRQDQQARVAEWDEAREHPPALSERCSPW